MYCSYYMVFLTLSKLVIGRFNSAEAPLPHSQVSLTRFTEDGHNEPYYPNPAHPIPGKLPFKIDEDIHYYQKYINGSEDGYYRRSSCPALNILANRGFINRSGRNITSNEIAKATREVFNFGDDNVNTYNLPALTRGRFADSAR